MAWLTLPYTVCFHPSSFPSLHTVLIHGTLTTWACFHLLQQATLTCLRASRGLSSLIFFFYLMNRNITFTFSGASPLSKLDHPPPPQLVLLTIILTFFLRSHHNFTYVLSYFLKYMSRGAWVAQVKHPTSAQVMILRFVSSSLMSGSVLTAQSLEPASDSVCVFLSAPPPAHALSLSLSQ